MIVSFSVDQYDTYQILPDHVQMTSWVYWENTSSVCPSGDPQRDPLGAVPRWMTRPQRCRPRSVPRAKESSGLGTNLVWPTKKKGWLVSCYKNSKHATVLETLAWFLKISSWNIPPLIGLHMLPKCYNDRNDITNSWNWPPHGVLRFWKRTSMAIPAGWHLWKTCTFNGDLMVI